MNPQEVTALWQRIIALENGKASDAQKLFALEEKLKSYDNYFKNIKPPTDYTPVLKDLNARLLALEIAFVHNKQKSIWDIFKK
ncbi:MAG: hypothetical protein AAB875_01190 [Patescibacteria group bacterium]